MGSAKRSTTQLLLRAVEVYNRAAMGISVITGNWGALQVTVNHIVGIITAEGFAWNVS